MTAIRRLFRRLSAGVARITGSPWGLLAALVYLVIVGRAGQLDMSDPVLAISVAAWLQLFPLQSSTLTSERAIQAKLNAIILALRGVSNRLALAERLPDEELDRLEAELRALAEDGD